MSELVARTGRHQQRYEDGYRMIAGWEGALQLGRLQKQACEIKHTNDQRCIPFKYRNVEKDSGDASEKTIEILMITSTGGPGLVFPKGGWEDDETAQEAATREAMEEAGVRGDLLHFLGFYAFKSKTIQEECSPDNLCKAAMYALHVKEELESWPEKSHRGRHWLTIHEAIQNSRHTWMRDALEKGFTKWYTDGVANTLSTRDHPSASRIM